MKKIILLFFSLIFFLLTGCGSSANPTEVISGSEYIPSNEDIVETHGRLKNLEGLDEFSLNVQSDKPDKVRLVRYTIEGDPILHDLSYKKGNIEFRHDSTRDQYGSGKISTYHCEGLVRNEMDTEITYILENCPEDMRLLSISYNVEHQDYFEFALQYGVNLKNEINTRDMKLVKELQNGETVEVSDFQLSTKEKQKIYKKMVLSNYLSEKKLSMKCNQKPYERYNLKVWINSGTREFTWTDCDNSKDGKAMTKLANDIINVLKKNEIYKTLPEVQGHYE